VDFSGVDLRRFVDVRFCFNFDVWADMLLIALGWNLMFRHGGTIGTTTVDDAECIIPVCYTGRYKEGWFW
jgi:hypothetical protein